MRRPTSWGASNRGTLCPQRLFSVDRRLLSLPEASRLRSCRPIVPPRLPQTFALILLLLLFQQLVLEVVELLEELVDGVELLVELVVDSLETWPS